MKGAKRALGTFQKAGRPIEVRLDGANVTVRVAGRPGRRRAEEAAKRVTPKDPAEKAAKQAAAAPRRAAATPDPVPAAP